MNITIVKKAVNSKLLFEEINNLILDGFNSVRLNWRNDDERGLFIEFLSTLFIELIETNHIEQWKVQCNNNNNKTQDMVDGTFNLDIFYKQKHCLNVTNIRYIIQED